MNESIEVSLWKGALSSPRGVCVWYEVLMLLDWEKHMIVGKWTTYYYYH